MQRRRLHISIPLQEVNMFSKSLAKKILRYIYTLQKGGATKTEKCFNFAIAGAKSGKRVLVIDMDQGQGNVTQALGYVKDTLRSSVFTCITGKSTPAQTILHTYYDPRSGVFFDPQNKRRMEELGIESLDQAERGPDLLPMSTIHCKDQEFKLIQQGNWGSLLNDVLDDIQDQYDEMHIDSSPDIENVFSKMAVYAADYVVVPLVPEARHVDGLSDLAQWVINASLVNKRLTVAGIIFSRVYYKHHTSTMTRVNDVIVPQINRMIEKTREQSDRLATRLEGLHFSCLQSMDRESKVYGEDTSRRANILSTPLREKPSEIVPVLEVWSEYIELLQITEGDYRQAAIIFNDIQARYAQLTSKENKHAKESAV